MNELVGRHAEEAEAILHRRRFRDEKPVFEFHVSRRARDRYGVADTLFSLTGNVVFANLAASREFAQRMNQVREAAAASGAGGPSRRAERHGADRRSAARGGGALPAAAGSHRSCWTRWPGSRRGWDERRWIARCWPLPKSSRRSRSIGDGRARPSGWPPLPAGVPHRAVALEELMMLWLANLNPAFQPFRELFDDKQLAAATAYRQITAGAARTTSKPARVSVRKTRTWWTCCARRRWLRPTRWPGSLQFIRARWVDLLGEFIRRLLTALDVLKEEEIAIWMRFHPPGQHRPGRAAVRRFQRRRHPQFSARRCTNTSASARTWTGCRERC